MCHANTALPSGDLLLSHLTGRAFVVLSSVIPLSLVADEHVAVPQLLWCKIYGLEQVPIWANMGQRRAPHDPCAEGPSHFFCGVGGENLGKQASHENNVENPVRNELVMWKVSKKKKEENSS